MERSRKYGGASRRAAVRLARGPLRILLAALFALAVLLGLPSQLGLTGLLGLPGLAIAPAEAQQAPADVGAGWVRASGADRYNVDLPEPPEGYLTEQRGQVTWTFPAAATGEARALQDAFADAWERIAEDLGQDIDGELVIRMGRNPEQMHALAPTGHPPPDYASGVAYPRFGVILLTLTAPETWERPDMEAVLAHELSHIALYRAIDGNPVPRWFSEGLAIYQAGEYSLDRARTLWSAVVAGNVVSLERISGRFPSRAHRVNVAYAASADMVAFMRRDARDARSFRILIRHLRGGMGFENAVRESYDATLPSLEREWRVTLQERFQTLPLLLTGGGIWVLVSFFLVFVWIRKRRMNRRRLDAWAQQEADDEEALQRAEAAVVDKLRDAEQVQATLIIADEAPGGRDDVPTIEYDGRNHTLH